MNETINMPWTSHFVCRKKSKTRENGTNKERLEDEKEIHIEENPNAILAIQNLQCRQRRQSDTPSDSSLESADEKLLKLEVCKQFQSQKITSQRDVTWPRAERGIFKKLKY